MFNTIRRKLILGFSVIITIVFLSTAYNVYSFTKSKNHIMHIKDKGVKSLELSNNLKNNIIQTRLYFADASASKIIDEMKKAEEHAKLFRENIDSLKKLSDEHNMLNEDIIKLFDKFYDYGKQMTNTYIQYGHEEGNKKMKEFDMIADELYMMVEEFQKKSQESMDIDIETIYMHMTMNQTRGIVIAFVTLILSIIIAAILSSKIRKPIAKLQEMLNDIEKGKGDLTKRIEIKSKDEIGTMAKAFNRFLDSMESMMASIKISSEIVSKSSEKLSEGGYHTTNAIESVNEHMLRVTEDTSSISKLISDITYSISEIASTSQNTASDSQEICNSANDINIIAAQSRENALKAKLEMESIEDISSKTIRLTQELGNEANEIGKIIDTIKAITDQTNLLALNASIEAARAGEHGRGFSVVAQEIRKLAENNTESAKIIEQLISNILSMINQTITSTNEVGKSIRQGTIMVESVYEELHRITQGVSEINERIQNIAASTEEQGATTEELSAVMDSINSSNTEISVSVKEVAVNLSKQTDTIKDLSLTASNLNESAEKLNGLVNKFRIKL